MKRAKILLRNLPPTYLYIIKQRKNLPKLLPVIPNFGFTQFLLAQKLSNDHDADATKQLQHAALYFPNLFWMDYLLKENNVSINKGEHTMLKTRMKTTTKEVAAEESEEKK
jgi:hypothetical protein